jgi:hypothetical protein
MIRREAALAQQVYVLGHSSLYVRVRVYGEENKNEETSV